MNTLADEFFDKLLCHFLLQNKHICEIYPEIGTHLTLTREFRKEYL